jgi:hypothetical protein
MEVLIQGLQTANEIKMGVVERVSHLINQYGESLH